MVKVTKKFLQDSLKDEIKANKDYMKHSNTKGFHFLKEIAHDEKNHQKRLRKAIKNFDKRKR